MPIDPLSKAQPGDPLVIPASTYNSMVDLVADSRSRGRFSPTSLRPDPRALATVPIRNQTGAALARFAVVGIGDPVLDPASSLLAWQNRPALDGIVPTIAEVGRFAIVLEPIPAGAIGDAAIAGVVPVQVAMVDAADRFADVLVTDTAKLLSGPRGAASLLWVQDEADWGAGDVAWALVRLAGAAQSTSSWLAETGTPVAQGGNRWSYPVSEVYLSSGGVLSAASSPRTGTAWNLMEVQNDGAFPEGYGLTEPAGTTVTIDPLALGSIVQITPMPNAEGGETLVFNGPFPLGVACS